MDIAVCGYHSLLRYQTKPLFNISIYIQIASSIAAGCGPALIASQADADAPKASPTIIGVLNRTDMRLWTPCIELFHIMGNEFANLIK